MYLGWPHLLLLTTLSPPFSTSLVQRRTPSSCHLPCRTSSACCNQVGRTSSSCTVVDISADRLCRRETKLEVSDSTSRPGTCRNAEAVKQIPPLTWGGFVFVWLLPNYNKKPTARPPGCVGGGPSRASPPHKSCCLCALVYSSACVHSTLPKREETSA